MYLANLGTAEPNIGGNFAINAIAATLVGGTTISGGNGKVSNAVVGALIVLCLSNGMIQIGVPSVWQQFIIGSVIIFSVVMERILQKLSAQYE
jgi:ribose transport system permease protein